MPFGGKQLDFLWKRGERDQLKRETGKNEEAGVDLLGVKKSKVVKVKV